MATAEKNQALYGVMAQFADEVELMHAAEKAKAEGYVKMDAYSPIPIEGMIEAMGAKQTRLPYFVFCIGLTGCLTGLGLQTFVHVVEYPIAIAGRPLFSWQAFIPIIFECTILFSVLACVFGMLGRNGFPEPYHPVFNVDAFKAASRDGFFLCIEATDPKFSADKVSAFLKGLKAKGVYDVEP